MIGRSFEFELDYDKYPISSDIMKDVESISYTDCAADESDSIDVTICAKDSKWINSWLPEKKATLTPTLSTKNWEKQGDNTKLKCGIFVLDDISYADLPSSLTLSGVARPSDTDFSKKKNKVVWKKTSISRIGKTIAKTYGLGFVYDAEDYKITSYEQDDEDSAFYEKICKEYGLILKVYSKKIWVYDREKYKEKDAVLTITKKDITPGSFNWNTTLDGRYTGGTFTYTDQGEDKDIKVSIGGGENTMEVNRKASSKADAAVQLVADLNNANHGTTKISFSIMGNLKLSAAQNIELSGYGKLSGKYFIDKITHSMQSGFTSSLECSLVEKAFHAYQVGGSISYNKPDTDEYKEKYTSTYSTTSPNATATDKTTTTASESQSDTTAKALNISKGTSLSLNDCPIYTSSVTKSSAGKISGTYYLYDAILVAGRYRVCETADRCGKLPVGRNVAGWIDVGYVNK